VEDIVISDNFSKNIIKDMFLSFFIFKVWSIRNYRWEREL
jgi:hypothetical protein